MPLDSTMHESAVYRVVQESLTNIARHAPEASARVEITRTAHHVLVLVSDDGCPVATGTAGAGFGLAGLAERVRGTCGTFVAGLVAGGGFEVRATVGTAPSTARRGPA